MVVSAVRKFYTETIRRYAENVWEMLLLLIKDIGKAKTLVYEYETKDRFNNIYLKKIYYVPFLILHENIHIPLTTPKYRSCERKIIDTFRNIMF